MNDLIISNCIEPKYKYIAIFTNLDNDRNLSVHIANLDIESEEGYSGNWIIAQSRTFQKVLLYIRKEGQNKIYLGDYSNRENIEERRSRIYFKNLKFIGITNLHWGDFTGSSNAQSPIRYFG